MMIKGRDIGWALHIACTVECHFGYKLETKRPLEKHKLRLKDKFKINVKEMRRSKTDSFTSE
jgi:hypothetical protein